MNTHFPASFLFKTLQTFSIGFASGDCDGQSKVVMPFSVFQAVQRRLRYFGSLSSCKIQSAVSAPNIFVADLRRPLSYIWSIFWAFKFSVKSPKHPKPLLARCCLRFAFFRKIVDCFIGFITLNPLLHEPFRLFDVFSSGCIGHKWSLWMGTQEDRFKTFRVHRTHYDSRLLSRTIRAILNRLGNCAIVLWMYFHYKKKTFKNL